MCNDYRLEIDIASIAEDFDNLQIKIYMPEGAPNVPAREDVRITDTAPIVKSSDGAAAGSLVNRRWSWPGQGGKPVYNVRSERRDLGMQRCLVLCDGFYEFTDPTDPAQKRLDKWPVGFCIGRAKIGELRIICKRKTSQQGSHRWAVCIL